MRHDASLHHHTRPAARVAVAAAASHSVSLRPMRPLPSSTRPTDPLPPMAPTRPLGAPLPPTHSAARVNQLTAPHSHHHPLSTGHHRDGVLHGDFEMLPPNTLMEPSPSLTHPLVPHSVPASVPQTPSLTGRVLHSVPCNPSLTVPPTSVIPPSPGPSIGGLALPRATPLPPPLKIHLRQPTLPAGTHTVGPYGGHAHHALHALHALPASHEPAHGVPAAPMEGTRDAPDDGVVSRAHHTQSALHPTDAHPAQDDASLVTPPPASHTLPVPPSVSLVQHPHTPTAPPPGPLPSDARREGEGDADADDGDAHDGVDVGDDGACSVGAASDSDDGGEDGDGDAVANADPSALAASSVSSSSTAPAQWKFDHHPMFHMVMQQRSLPTALYSPNGSQRPFGKHTSPRLPPLGPDASSSSLSTRHPHLSKASSPLGHGALRTPAAAALMCAERLALVFNAPEVKLSAAHCVASSSSDQPSDTSLPAHLRPSLAAKVRVDVSRDAKQPQEGPHLGASQAVAMPRHSSPTTAPGPSADGPRVGGTRSPSTAKWFDPFILPPRSRPIR